MALSCAFVIADVLSVNKPINANIEHDADHGERAAVFEQIGISIWYEWIETDLHRATKKHEARTMETTKGFPWITKYVRFEASDIRHPFI